jgi:hypothetical protein
LDQRVAGQVTPRACTFIACISIIIFDGVPVPGMGVYPQPNVRDGTVTGDAGISITVAGAAGQQIAASLPGMICRPLMRGKQPARVTGRALGGVEIGVIRADGTELDIAELSPVRKELQALGAEFGMALAAVILVMTAVAMLGIVHRLHWMDFKPVATVTFGRIIGLVIPGREVRIDAATLMAVEAEILVVAVPAILLSLVCKQSMAAQPVGIMIGRYALAFVTCIAIGNLHVGIIFVSLFRRLFLRFLLRLISRRLLGKGHVSEKHRQCKEHE